MGDYAAKLKDLLTTTAEQKASDLHLGVGKKPTIRISGTLYPISKEPELTPESAEGIVSCLLTAEQKQRLMKDKQIDLAYPFSDQARFRTNVFFQRGHYTAALRFVQGRVRGIDELNLPEVLHEFPKLFK